MLTLVLILTQPDSGCNAGVGLVSNSVAAAKAEAKTITYFVNGESQTTQEHKLTPKVILTNAGFTPPEDFRLIRSDGDKELVDLDKEESIHKNEQFTALFKGTTPVS